MKLQTHFMIAKIAAEYSGFTFWERSMFCIGSLIPDLSPMQFVHCHFYASSGEYVQKKLKSIAGKNSLSALLTYGKMAHYISDFCCSVHSGNGIGNVREHILYERALNCYALEKRDLLKAECEGLSKHQEFTSILNDYHHSKRYDFNTDLIFAIRACVGICDKASYSRKTQKSVPIEIADGGIHYGCHSSNI